MKKINAFSCFNGIGISRLALDKAGIPYDKFFTSEVDPKALKVTQERYPDDIPLGDIRNIEGWMLALFDINLMVGGSPCQGFSMMGKRKGMTTKDNILVISYEQYMNLKNDGFEFDGQSYLFWEFIRLWKEVGPDYFLLENVKMNKRWERIITATLGVEPIIINSSLFSAQNRLRYYWTNIPNLLPIEDKGITIDQVIPNAVVGAGKRGRILPGDNEYTPWLSLRKDGKANCVVTNPYGTGRYISKDGEYLMITPEEAEALQTIARGWTNVEGVSKTDRFKMIGNSWTTDVVAHLFSNLKPIFNNKL